MRSAAEEARIAMFQRRPLFRPGDVAVVGLALLIERRQRLG
jgi:hypothetical protein